MIVNVQEFRDDDAAHVNWRTEHEGGYVRVQIDQPGHHGPP